MRLTLSDDEAWHIQMVLHHWIDAVDGEDGPHLSTHAQKRLLIRIARYFGVGDIAASQMEAIR